MIALNRDWNSLYINLVLWFLLTCYFFFTLCSEFWWPEGSSLLKTLLEKKKMLATSLFSPDTVFMKYSRDRLNQSKMSLLGKELTWPLYHTIPSYKDLNPLLHRYSFDASATDSFWKHCGKRRNCSSQAISHFPTMFSTQLLRVWITLILSHCIALIHNLHKIHYFAVHVFLFWLSRWPMQLEIPCEKTHRVSQRMVPLDWV